MLSQIEDIMCHGLFFFWFGTFFLPCIYLSYLLCLDFLPPRQSLFLQSQSHWSATGKCRLVWTSACPEPAACSQNLIWLYWESYIEKRADVKIEMCLLHAEKTRPRAAMEKLLTGFKSSQQWLNRDRQSGCKTEKRKVVLLRFPIFSVEYWNWQNNCGFLTRHSSVVWDAFLWAP